MDQISVVKGEGTDFPFEYILDSCLNFFEESEWNFAYGHNLCLF